MSVLIAYYSREGENYFGGAYRTIPVGNTEKAARMLADITGGTLSPYNSRSPIPTGTKPALSRRSRICKTTSDRRWSRCRSRTGHTPTYISVILIIGGPCPWRCIPFWSRCR